MKLIHLGDIHIGKRVNGISMLEDQAYIFDQIYKLIEEEGPDAVLIAGDLYDKTVPGADAVGLCDEFLVNLSKRCEQLFIISGNHDSAERVAFGGRIMEERGVHLSPVYGGRIQSVTLQDQYGPVNFYLIPFLKPGMVRSYVEDGENLIRTFQDAMSYVVDHLELDLTKRNVALAHQFFSGGQVCDSEEVNVGGLDEIDRSVMDPFDYVALGHLHGPQKVGRESMRYAGSPLKYSFSEISQKKGVTVVELGAKGEEPKIRLIPLKPLHELQEIRGNFAELVSKEFKAQYDCEDYFRIILTDEKEEHMAASKLRKHYPNWMILEHDNSRTRNKLQVNGPGKVKEKSPDEIFGDFYKDFMGREMSQEQKTYFAKLLERVKGDKE